MTTAASLETERWDRAMDVVLAAGPFQGVNPVRNGQGKLVLFVPNPDHLPVVVGKASVVGGTLQLSLIREIDPAVSHGRPRPMDQMWWTDPYRIPRTGDALPHQMRVVARPTQSAPPSVQNGIKKTNRDLSHQEKVTLDEEERRDTKRSAEIRRKDTLMRTIFVLSVAVAVSGKLGLSKSQIAGLRANVAKAQRELVFGDVQGPLGI